MIICPHTIDSKLHNLILRISGFLFIFVAFTFGPEGTLSNTLLMQSLHGVYPTWRSFIVDIVIFIFTISLVVLILSLALIVEEKHRTSKKIMSITRWLEYRILKNLFSILSWTARTGIALFVGITVTLLLQATKLEYIPSFSDQPIVFSIAVIGFACTIESISFWQRKLHALFCIH